MVSRFLYAAWDYWGPGCTYVTIRVCYLICIWRSMRKMEREAMADRSVWHDDDITECDTEFYS